MSWCVGHPFKNFKSGVTHTLDMILLVVDHNLGHGSCFGSARPFNELLYYYMFSGLCELWRSFYFLSSRYLIFDIC